MAKSRLRLVLCGGVVEPKTATDTAMNPYGVQSPALHFDRYGLGLIGLGLALALLAPLVVLPSRAGIVPFQYSDTFLNAPPVDQYLDLLLKNALLVLKQLKLDVTADMPKPPDSLLGNIAVVTVALLDLAAAISLGIGVKCVVGNIKKLRDI